MKRHLAAVTSLALLLGGPTPGTAGPEAPELVSVRLEWEPSRVASVTAKKVEWTKELPEGVKPPADLADARFAQLPLGEGRLTLVLDAAEDRRRIWIDPDMDGDVTDDRFGRWDKTTGTTHRREETVLVPVAGDKQPVPVTFTVFGSYTARGDDPLSFSYYLTTHRRGAVELNGRLRTVAVQDGNHDLRFDDPQADRIYLDVDGDGALRTDAGSHEELAPGATVRVGDRGYRVLVPDPAGGSVEFEQVAEPPPPAPRRWKKMGVSSTNYRPAPPAASLDELLATYRKDAEDGKPYADRHAVVTSIGSHGTAAAFAALRDIAEDDSDRNVRAAAVRAMGNAAYVDDFGDDVAEFAGSSDVSLAGAAIQSLHRMGWPKRGKVYRELLDSGNASIAGNAARHLVYLGEPDGIAAVERMCREGSQDQLRYQAYQGLRSLPAGPPVDLIVKSAEDRYQPLAAMALGDLFTLGHERTHALALAAAEVRPVQITMGRTVAKVLGAAADQKGTEALLQLVADGPETLHKDLRTALGALRSRGAVLALIDGLDHDEPSVRALAAQVLGGIRKSGVSEAMLKRLRKEKDENAAVAQIEALGDLGDPGAVALVLKAARKKGALRQAAVRALARIGFGLPKVRAFLIKLLGSKSAEERILAIDAVGEHGDAAIGKKILPNLDHKEWPVRLATAEALRKIRERDWVRPLVDRLAVEEETRVRKAIGQTLFELTGANLYDETALWERWWTDNGKTFAVPDTIPRLPEVKKGQTVGGFFGIPVDSDRVTFVIDQSGSMSARAPALDDDGRQFNRLDQAVREVLHAMGRLSGRARANVIFFHTTIHPWRDKLTKLGKGVRKKMEKHLLGQRPTGGTNLYDGLEMALLDDDVDTIMLLSDGVPGSGKYVATEDILRAVRRLNQTRRIAIHCVSLGRDSELLERLAKENGGRYVRR